MGETRHCVDHFTVNKILDHYAVHLKLIYYIAIISQYKKLFSKLKKSHLC